MKLGFNVTSVKDIAIAKSLLEAGDIDFVELLIDGFIYVDPKEIQRQFVGVPVAFHIIDSNFLQNSEKNLQYLGGQIKRLADVLDPLMMSDHLLQFRHGEIELPMFQELDYANESFEEVFAKIARWERILGTHISLENVASVDARGERQADYFRRQLAETNSGVLLDFSNLDITLKNTQACLTDWSHIINSCHYFHVGGYQKDTHTQSLYLDTHDSAVAEDSVSLIQQSLFRRGEQDIYLVYERDFNYDTSDIHRDIRQLNREIRHGLDLAV